MELLVESKEDMQRPQTDSRSYESFLKNIACDICTGFQNNYRNMFDKILFIPSKNAFKLGDFGSLRSK